jgi:hypothetical protein
VRLDESGIDTSMVVWEDYILNKTAAQALIEKAEGNGSAVDEAKYFLLELLKRGRVPLVWFCTWQSKLASPRRPCSALRRR